MNALEAQIQKARSMVKAGLPADAEALLRQHLKRSPREPLLQAELAGALARQGKRDQALYFAKAAAESGSIAGVESAAGVLWLMSEAEASIGALRRAVSLDPSRACAHNDLGVRLIALRRLDEARAAIERAYALDPRDPPVGANLALIYSETWSLEEGLAILRLTREQNPESPMVQQQMPFLANYSDRLTPAEVFAEHRRFAALAVRTVQPVAEPVLGAPTPADADRVLRVGVLSADFMEHAVAKFVEPFLREHDPARVRYTLYPVLPGEDETTRRFKSMAEAWSTAATLPEPEAVAAMRRDGIDILLDLAGLTRGMRAGILIARAAPLQVSYLGYPNTTGMPNVDARIVDSITDPPGAETFATERLLRLDPCFLCFSPPPVVRDTPSRGPAGDRPVTFGSFNNLAKITPTTLDLWAAILREVPNSRLFLKATALSLAGVRQRFSAALAARGIDPSRVELCPYVEDLVGHYRLYDRVDIALDSVPYNGTTTTCEALFMGVPVVTLHGDRHAARVGTSLLSAVGVPELVARDSEGYIRTAVELAASPERRNRYHESLRTSLMASPLADAPAFARRFEAALRAAWKAVVRQEPPRDSEQVAPPGFEPGTKRL